MNTVATIPFHGTNILAVEVDGKPHVALRQVCETLGLDWSAQHRRLKRQPWASIAVTATQVPGDKQSRDTTLVDRQTFTMWLATVETSRLKSDSARELLIAFQREAADVLDRYFHEGGAINPRADEHQINAIIRQSQMQIELCQAAKGLIHADHLEARARVVLARGLGEHAELDQGRRPLYTQTYLAEKNLSNDKLKSIAGMFGKRLKKLYIEHHGCPPAQYPLDLKNGQVRNVNAYTEADRPLMDRIWDEHYALVAI